jgi:hypothetical protein
MAPLTNSYGTAADVAALSYVWTAAGSFDENTRPTITEVESFINQISSLVNSALAGEGFVIPITQSDAVLSCVSIVAQIVSDMVAAANSTGRFFTEKSLKSGLSNMQQIRKEIAEWAEDQATGLEALGAERSGSLLGDIATRDSDADGNVSDPIFDREQYISKDGV